MKSTDSPLIVTNILGSDIPGMRLVRQRRTAEEIPTVAILEKKKRNGSVDLHIVIRGLNRPEKQYAKQVLKSLGAHFENVPEAELYARLYPRVPRPIPKRAKPVASRKR